MDCHRDGRGCNQDEDSCCVGTALRIYIYYSFEEWENVLREQLPDAVGEDVYLYVRDKTNVRYSFQYAVERKPNSDSVPLPLPRVRSFEIDIFNTCYKAMR